MLLLPLLAGCYQSKPCSREALEAALLEATVGDVVEVGSCEVRGDFVVPPGVRLEGQGADRTSLVGVSGGAALTLVPGDDRTSLAHLAIESDGCAAVLASGAGAVAIEDVVVRVRGGVGLALERGVDAEVTGTSVEGPVTPENAERIAPDRPGAATVGLFAADALLALEGVDVHGFAAAGAVLLASQTSWEGGLVDENLGLGLLVQGGDARLASLEIAHTLRGSLLAPAFGAVLNGGATVSSQALTIRDGEGPGLLATHASGRHAALEVIGNADVGVWLSGASALSIEGGRIADNALAGVVVQGSHDVTLRDLVVERTAWAATIVDGLGRQDIADGIELIDSTDGIVLERVSLRDHPRAGAVLDLHGGDGSGIELRDVEASGEGLGVVTQRGLPRAGWDDGVARDGETAGRDAAFAADGDVLGVAESAPAGEVAPPPPGSELVCSPP